MYTNVTSIFVTKTVKSGIFDLFASMYMLLFYICLLLLSLTFEIRKNRVFKNDKIIMNRLKS